MADNAEQGGDFFTEVGKWFNLAVDCNRALLDDALEQVNKPHKQAGALMNSLASVAESVINCDPQCVQRLLDQQLTLIGDQLTLIDAMTERLRGGMPEPVIEPEVDDRRFADEEWTANPYFDFIKQSYLLNKRALFGMVDSMSLAEADREKVHFYARQFSSALAPSNFPLSNPEIVRSIQESRGESLLRGLRQLVEDQKRSGEFLNVCMSDHQTFVVGENIASTPGKVVYENRLMQLIQYQPTQASTFQRPLLFIPSWINKYYVYDLQESNSLVRWALDKGFTVFMISWVNPDASHRSHGFDDYISLGILAALARVRAIAGVDSVNCVGYCLGGALLAAATAYLSHRGDNSIASSTYLATSFDFSDPGDFRVLLDENLVNGISQVLKETGYFDGRELAVSFSMLRENELYWNYYIQNYLKGERPGAFDILHWNSDSTNVTERMHLFILQELMGENLFMQEQGFTVLGERVCLRRSTTPGYILAAEKDHIARWQSCYAGARLNDSNCRFVLAGSGHIAGVINPVHKNKYHYYTGRQLSEHADDWLAGAFRHEGSWWRDWYCWLTLHAGPRYSALPIAEQHVIEDAPGRYVRRRLDTEIPAEKADSVAA